MVAELSLFLIDLVARATVILLAAWLLAAMLRRAPAAARHAVWGLSLLGLLLLPALVTVLPRWQLPILPAKEISVTEPPATETALGDARRPDTPALSPTVGTSTKSAADAVPIPLPIPAEDGGVAADKSAGESVVRSQPTPEPSWSWSLGLLLAWCLGTMLLVLRLLRSLRVAAGLVRRATEITDATARAALTTASQAAGLHRRVWLCESAEIAGPLTWGIWQPAILMPPDARDWAEPQRQTILVHELSHVRRRDCAVQVMGHLAIALFWFHPLAWLAGRKLHLEQERACDDVVLRQGYRASDYAGLLIQAAQRPGHLLQPALVAAVMTSPSELMSRMTYMLDGRQRHDRLSGAARLLLPALAVATVGGLGILQPAEQNARPPEIGKERVRKEQDTKKQDPKRQDTKKSARKQDPKDKKKDALAKRLVGMLDLASHRAVTIRELEKLGAPAVPHLLGALDNKDEAVVIVVLDALGRMLDLRDQAVLPLVRMATDKREQIARRAIDTLSRLADYNAAAMDALFGLLNAKDPKVVRTAIRKLALQRTQQKRIATALIARLSDKNISIVADAAAVLAKMPGQQHLVIPALIARLDSKRYEVKLVALQYLGSMGPAAKAATPKVEVLAESKDAVMAKAARTYLHLMQMQIIIADYSDNRIAVYRGDGKLAWQVEEIFGVWDAELLANGNLLITEFSVNRVREVTRKGWKTVWEFEDLKNPYEADRLANGNTLIADTFGRRVIEVNKKGKIVWKYDKGIQPYDVERLANGNTLIADGNDDRVIEVNKKGEIVWKLGNLANVHDVDRLPNGNTLLTIRMLNLVREVDPKGKTVMEIKGLSAPSDADRLANGNTMVAENGGVRMFDKDGKEIWRLKTTWAVEVNVSK